MSYIEKLKLQQGNAIVLIRAAAKDGTPFYAYMSMTAKEYAAAQDIFSTGKPFELMKLGKLIHTEMKAEPTETVKQWISEEYGLLK